MSFFAPYLTLPEFSYVQPKTLDEALAILDDRREQIKVVAGGVGVVNLMKERLIEPKTLLDIKRIPELSGISYKEGTGLRIGAAVTTNQVEAHPIVRERYHALREAMSVLADSILRNRITLLGNLCEAFPWIDSMPPLLVFDAKVDVSAKDGRRMIPVNEFVKGPLETALAPNELGTAIYLPDVSRFSKSRYVKQISRTEFGVVNIAAYYNGKHGRERIVRVAFGAVSPVPTRVEQVEKIFSADGDVSSLIDRAAKAAAEQVSPMSDIHGSEDYKAYLVDVLTRKTLAEILRS